MINGNLVVITLLTTVAMAQPALAQPASETVFEEIIVTAQKREQSIYEVPVSISAFSGDAIRKSGITDLIDVGKFVPNLNVTTFSAGHTSSANPFIRGIGLQDHLITTDPGVGVYVDGVYLGRQVGQNWNLSNIERLEVLRGPQGTLYGRNSIGGAINIITHKPGAEEVSRVSVEAGSRGRVNADFYSNFTLNDDVAVLLSGALKRRDGVGEFLNLPNAEADVGELQDISARVALAWTPADNFSLLLTADGNAGDNGLNPYTTMIDEVPNGGVFGAGYRNSDVSGDPYDNNTGQVDQTAVSNSASGLSLTAEYGFSENLAAKLLLSKRRSDYEGGLDDDSFIDNFLTFPETGFAEQISFELQLTGEYDKVDFVTGLYYFEEEGFNDQRPTIFLGNTGTFRLEQEVESHAIFANLGYQVTDDLRLSGGLRYTEDEKDARIDINDSFINTGANASFDEISWEFSVTWNLNDSLTAYGTLANGYQSGQFPARPFCLFGNLDTSQPGNVTPVNCFVPSDNITALNHELGIKGQPFENLQMSLAVFRTEYEDLPYQVSTTTLGGFNTVNLVVDQDSTGVEWESSLRLAENFYIRTAVGYIDVEVDDPVAVAPLTPEWTFAISPEYSFPAGGGTISLRADYSYRADMFGEPSPDRGRFTRLDSRGLLNFDVAYQSADESWTAALYGRNVTDKRYENARLNTGDYILVILSNDASEFGMRFIKDF